MRDKIKGLLKKLRYEIPLQTFIQLYLVQTLAVGFSLIAYILDYDGNIGGAAQTVIYFALIFIAPFGFAFFLVYKKLTKQLKKEVTKERFGVLYKDMRYKYIWSLMFLPIFLFRRLIFVLGIVWWHNEAEVQWAAYFYVAMIMTVYLAYHRPFKSK